MRGAKTSKNTAVINGYPHEKIWATPEEQMILRLFGGGTHPDGSQKWGPDGLKSFDPNDPDDPDDSDNDTAGHGGMSTDPSDAEDVADMSFGTTGYGFGGFGGMVGAVTAIGDLMGEIAAAAGVNVDEPTGTRGGDPAAFGGGDQGNDVGGATELLAALAADPGLQTLVNPDDVTQRVEGVENLAIRQRLFELYQRTQQEDYRITREEREFLQQYLGEYSDDNQSVNWGVQGGLDRTRIAELLNSDALQATVVDRDFGELAGFNQSLAETYRDFTGDFGEGQWNEYATAAGITDEVAALSDEWFGANDSLNQALAREYGFADRFGGDRFWNFIDQEGIDRSEVQGFIDAFNGSQPVQVGDPVYDPISGSGTGPISDWDPTIVDDTGDAPVPLPEPVDNGWGVQGPSVGTPAIPTIEIPEIDLSFLDDILSSVRSGPSTTDVIQSSAANAVAESEARTDINDFIIPLDSPRRRRQQLGLRYDAPAGGLNLL